MLLLPQTRRRKKDPAADHPASDRRPGRPMKRIAEMKPPYTARIQLQQIMRDRVNADPAHDARLQLSPLEQLPAELIQQIFFHCFEVNIPRASPRLAEVLSTKSIYTVLVLFAYFDDDGNGDVETKHFRPAEYRTIGVDEKMRLQAAILSCRWFSLELVSSCIPILSRLQMVQAWHREDTEERILRETAQARDSLELFDPPVSALALLPAVDDADGMQRHFFAQTSEEPVEDASPEAAQAPAGNDGFLTRIIPWNIVEYRPRGQSHNPRRWTKRTHPADSVLATRVIPARLLRGQPWTPAKLELLRLLREGLRYIGTNHYLKTSAPAMFSGMASAIREQDEAALLTLVELYDAITTLHPMHDALQIRTAIHAKRHFSRPSAHPLPLRLFHLAASPELPWDVSVRYLSILVRAGIDSIPSDDAKLTSWAVRAGAAGHEHRPFARWLLRHMDLTNTYGLVVGEPLFEHGRVNQFAAPSDPAFRQLGWHSSFSQELGYPIDVLVSAVPRNRDGTPCG